MQIKMDRGRLLQTGNGKPPSIVKIPPPPPPKPTKNGNGNGNGNGAHASNNDGVSSNAPPPPPLPQQETSSLAQDLSSNGAETVIQSTSKAIDEQANEGGGIGQTISENIQEEGKSFVTDTKDELVSNLLGGGEDEEEDPKTAASLLTKELLSLVGDDESELLEDGKELKPSIVKSGVKKLLLKSEKEEDETGKEEGTQEEKQETAETEKAGGEKDEAEEDGGDSGGGDDDDDDEDNCLSPKAFIIARIKPLLNEAKPYIQTLITNMFGVFIGAAVAYGTLQMMSDGDKAPAELSMHKPIQTFTVSPVSGIRSERSQAWITVDLEPLISGIRQLDSASKKGGTGNEFEVESASLILNVTHREEVEGLPIHSFNNINLTSESGKGENIATRTHLVTFRIKRQIDQLDSDENAEVTSSDPNKTNTTLNDTSTVMETKLNENETTPEAGYMFGQTNLNNNNNSETSNSTSNSSAIITPLIDNSAIIVLHEQFGAEDRFEDFIPLLPFVQEKITHLLLKYITVSPQQLLESLKFAKNLRSIELDEVQLLGHFDGRVLVPSLTEFSFHLVNSSLISNSAPIKTFLFFDKDGYWRLEKVTALGVDMELIFDGRKYFRIDHKKRQIVSQLLLTNLILENLDVEQFPLDSLALSFIELNINFVPNTITHLSLYSVTFCCGQTLQELLKKLTNLQSLELNSVVGANLVLSDLPSPSLKHLAFGRSNLLYAPGVFFNLDSIYLENVVSDVQVFTKFHELFNGTRVAISTFSSISSHTFLKNILQMPAVEWIYMENFNRQPVISTTLTTNNLVVQNSTTEESSNKTNKSSSVYSVNSDFDEIEWFLISCGVPANVEVFLLEKNKVTGLWSGHGLTIAEHKYLWFDLFDMEKFWTKSAVDLFNGLKGQKYITYYLSKTLEFEELTPVF